MFLGAMPQELRLVLIPSDTPNGLRLSGGGRVPREDATA
jgi:hypothetical protein